MFLRTRKCLLITDSMTLMCPRVFPCTHNRLPTTACYVFSAHPLQVTQHSHALCPCSPPRLLQVECGAKRDAHDALAAAVADCVREAAGSETLLLAVECLREAAADSVVSDSNPDPDPDPSGCARAQDRQHQVACSLAAGTAQIEAGAASAGLCSSSHAAASAKGSAARDVSAAAGRRAAAPGEQASAGRSDEGPIGRRVIW